MDIGVNRYWRNGYLVLRGLFAKDEISSFRERVVASAGTLLETSDGDLLANPLLRDILFDDRILDVASTLLGDTPVYFGDSSHTKFEKSTAPGLFHKDNVDRTDINGPDWKSRYTILRFGIYLQSHADQGGGLLVRKKSHHKPLPQGNRYKRLLDEEVASVLVGRTRYLPTETGDVLVWNLRTTHAPCGSYVRPFRWIPTTKRSARILPDFMQAKMKIDRYAMFASFGLPDHHLERYIAHLKTRTYMVDLWKACDYDQETRKLYATKNVIVRDMRKEISADIADGKEVGQSLRWQPYPY